MEPLMLEDLKDFTQKQVLEHLANTYSGDKSGHDYGNIESDDIKKASKKLKNMIVCIAYESVGSWGCDSSSYFLLQNKITKKLFEVTGSHCSCYGFEGQLDLNETTIDAIKMRKEVFSTGGYDDNSNENLKQAKLFVNKMK